MWNIQSGRHGLIPFHLHLKINGHEFSINVGNWLEYKDTESYKACEDIWAKFMTEKGSKSGLIGKVAPHRCVVQYDYS